VIIFVVVDVLDEVIGGKVAVVISDPVAVGTFLKIIKKRI
jgi:hypothetical protein